MFDFLEWVYENPVSNLATQPLIQFIEEGGVCEPGELISEYPFFFTCEATQGVTLSKVPALERRAFLVDINSQLKNLEDGQEFEINFKK